MRWRTSVRKGDLLMAAPSLRCYVYAYTVLVRSIYFKYNGPVRRLFLSLRQPNTRVAGYVRLVRAS